MKRCPKCGSVYSDNSLNYCLTDGTALTYSGEDDEIPTVVRDQRPAPETQVTRMEPGVSPIFKYLTVTLAVFVLLLGVAGFAAWSFWNSSSPAANTSNPAVATPQTPSRIPDAVAAKNAVAEPTPSVVRMPERTPASTPAPEPQVKDPGTARITFRKGNVSETVRGIVAEKRSFVLRTIQGQQLVALVSSPGRCVSMQQGLDSIAIITPSGDVDITIRNECGHPSPFTMKVTVR